MNLGSSRQVSRVNSFCGQSTESWTARPRYEVQELCPRCTCHSCNGWQPCVRKESSPLQNSSRTAPNAEKLAAEGGAVWIRVTEQNRSVQSIYIPPLCPDRGVIKFEVLLDGHPAPLTAGYQAELAEEAALAAQAALAAKAPAGLREEVSVSGGGGCELGPLLGPREQSIDNFELTDDYVMSAPGEYRITATVSTDPGERDNVTVRSNTVTLHVGPPSGP
jgi:hypothetical protein